MNYTNRKKIGLLLIAAGLSLQEFGPQHSAVIDFLKGLMLGSGILLVLLNDRVKSRFKNFKKRLRTTF